MVRKWSTVPISLSYSALTLAGERFDQRVLTAELQRVGGELPGPGALTTLSLLHLQGCWEAFCATGPGSASADFG